MSVLCTAERPGLSFREFKEKISPLTEHTPQTYTAYQIVSEQVPSAARMTGVDATFVVTGATRRDLPSIPRGTELRITAVSEEWIWAVPATYVANFWE